MSTLSDVRYVYNPGTLKMMALHSILRGSQPRQISKIMKGRGECWRCSSFDTWIGESVMQHALVT